MPSDSPYPLSSDLGLINLQRSENVSKARLESLRAATLGNVGLEEAKPDQRALNLASQVVAPPREFEFAAAAVEPARISELNQASIVVPVGKCLLYGVPVLFALAGLITWWRSRHREKPIKASPHENQTDAVKRGVEEAIPASPDLAAAVDASAPQRASPPSFKEPEVEQQVHAPQRALGVDLIATATVESALPTSEAQPATEQVQLDLVCTLPTESFPRAAQEAYFTGRFGGGSEDVKILHDLDNVIEQARSIFEDDNDPVKAADLLELAVALHPTEVRPWLALFAIYRRASLTRQFAMLGEKFRSHFGTDSNWPTIQRLGREIDAENPMYEAASAESVDASQTEEATQDVIDRWLDVPLDFTSVLLADELREAVTNNYEAPTTGDAPTVIFGTTGS